MVLGLGNRILQNEQDPGMHNYTGPLLGAVSRHCKDLITATHSKSRTLSGNFQSSQLMQLSTIIANYIASSSSGRSSRVSVISAETPFQILNKPFSFKFLFNQCSWTQVHNIQIVLLPDILRLL